MIQNDDCDVCGLEPATLVINGERVCRDCFASAVAGMMQTGGEDDIDEEEALERGYEAADCLLSGGRLPY